MKINKNIKVFWLQKNGSTQINFLNPKETLSEIINRFKKSSSGFIDLNYLLFLDYTKNSFDIVINNRIVKSNLYEDTQLNVSILEIEGNDEFILEELNKSILFVNQIGLSKEVKIGDYMSQVLESIIVD